MSKVIKLSVILSPLLLSGCMWQTIDNNDIKAAEHFCKDKGGIDQIISYYTGSADVRCVNGDYRGVLKTYYRENYKEFQ